MPAAGNIVIADGSAANHTFNYVPLPNNVAGFEDRAGGIMVGFNRLTMSLSRPKPNTSARSVGNRYYNALLKVEVPTLEALGTADSGFTPPPTVAYRTMAEVRIALPERSLLTNRRDVLAYLKNLLGNSFVVALVENYELPY